MPNVMITTLLGHAGAVLPVDPAIGIEHSARIQLGFPCGEGWEKGMQQDKSQTNCTKQPLSIVFNFLQFPEAAKPQVRAAIRIQLPPEICKWPQSEAYIEHDKSHDQSKQEIHMALSCSKAASNTESVALFERKLMPASTALVGARSRLCFGSAWAICGSEGLHECDGIQY